MAEQRRPDCMAGRLLIETPDGKVQFLGYAYGLAKNGLWVWNGRVWMQSGYMAKLEREA